MLLVTRSRMSHSRIICTWRNGTVLLRHHLKVHPRFVTGVVWLDTQGLNVRSWRKPNASRVVVVDIPPSFAKRRILVLRNCLFWIRSQLIFPPPPLRASTFEASGSAASNFATTVASVSMEVDNHMNTTTPASSTAGPMVEVTSGAIKVPGAKRSVVEGKSFKNCVVQCNGFRCRQGSVNGIKDKKVINDDFKTANKEIRVECENMNFELIVICK
ncbi:uncharacterized protein EV154DRAFT_481900 [Mucor mucedo]|uniref:uncharacterized protein n=1 Tax=Mucor mucedo TaxID=29922 RepID=UPI00221EAD9D|nr:uncharacterized protein EV154DRAFT_481900 [Mucor mucedo]KAI7890770.1 hypothetical protein EV154DRAFT_481900 [Mucor mucedo]